MLSVAVIIATKGRPEVVRALAEALRKQTSAPELLIVSACDPADVTDVAKVNPAVNVVYSVRGLFSVLLVWWVGHWFTNTESHAGRRVLLARLAGAVAMLGAIALVLA